MIVPLLLSVNLKNETPNVSLGAHLSVPLMVTEDAFAFFGVVQQPQMKSVMKILGIPFLA